MFAHSRHQSIVEYVRHHQKASVHELETALAVSPATLRRDLAELEASGDVIRTRGGVAHPSLFRGESSFSQRGRLHPAAKRALAETAARLVPAGATVFLDAGSTCFEVGRRLLPRPDVTLITHSLPLALAAIAGGARVICLGGEVRAVSGAAVGAFALTWLENLHADWAFVGASGLHPEEGPSTTEIAEAGMKAALMRRSAHTVLVADSTKWIRPAAVRFARWDDLRHFVTDGFADAGPASHLTLLREHAPHLRIHVPAPETGHPATGPGAAAEIF